jgi:hypothetical protein
MATFEMTIATYNLHGKNQLANRYGPDQAKAILTVSSNIHSCVISSFLYYIFSQLHFMQYAGTLKELCDSN